MRTNTKRLTESAMLLAIAIVLELVSKAIIPEQPFGGQITLVSMLPVVLISYRHGIRWGLVTGVCYAGLEMLLGIKNVSAAFQPGYFGAGTLLVNAFIMCILDYWLAFTVLGLGGIFRNRIQKSGIALMCGSLVALGLRYICHILSGCILFSGYAAAFFTQEGFPSWGQSLVESMRPEVLGLLYSVVYNGMFMIPEMILTAVACVFIGRIPQITRT